MLCNLLCFLSCRYSRDGVKQLKSALLDFYDVADLVTAKSQLLEDVKRIDKDSSIPHVPDRREGELRSIRVVDDMFTVLDCLDENQLLKCLPKYVADSPDAMPSMRLYEGDLAIIMRLFERMDGQMVEFGSQMAAILKQVQAIQQPATTGVVYRERVSTASIPEPTAFSQASREVGVGQCESVAVNDDRGQATCLSANETRKDWASIAVSSPVQTRNRFSAFELQDEDRDPLPLVEYESRRAKRRRRGSTAPQQRSVTSSDRAYTSAWWSTDEG